jgi:F0F1-type ATP synthase assembly protein I
LSPPFVSWVFDVREFLKIATSRAACDRIRFDVVDNPKRPPKSNALVSAARYSEIGFIIPAAVFLGYAIGRLLDYWLHTHWLYLAGVIFGAVVGFVQMIRMASALSRDKPDA